MSRPTEPMSAPSTGGTLLPAMMRAATRHRYGGPEVVAVEEVALPTLAAGEVLVRVSAAGIDRATLHLLTGLPYLARLAFGLRRPQQPVLGQQVAGEIVAVGDGVTAYAAGDRVCGTARGSLAEFAVATTATLALTPQSVTDVDAATIGVSGLTALGAIVTHGRLQPGDRVLILGGSGAVGSFAVQLAAHLGAEVSAACSGRKLEFVNGLGAQSAFDYQSVTLAKMNGPFDLIVDIGGNRRLSALRRALTAEGRLVIVGGENSGPLFGGLQRNLAASMANRFTRKELGWFFSRVTAEGCADVASLMASGAIRPAIDRQVGLAEVGRALASMQKGELYGQAVVCP